MNDEKRTYCDYNNAEEFARDMVDDLVGHEFEWLYPYVDFDSLSDHLLMDYDWKELDNGMVRIYDR